MSTTRYIPLIIQVKSGFFNQPSEIRTQTLLPFLQTQLGGEQLLSAVDMTHYNLDLTGLKIKHVRELIQELTYQGYQNSVRTICLWQVETASPAAQSALLKTLEEPPTQTLITLITGQSYQLLPTILSRCQIINLPFTENPDQTFHFDLTLLEDSYAGLITLAEQFKDRIVAQRWLSQLIPYIQQQPEFPNPFLTKLLQLSLQAQIELNQNVNPKLVCETMFFALHDQK